MELHWQQPEKAAVVQSPVKEESRCTTFRFNSESVEDTAEKKEKEAGGSLLCWVMARERGERGVQLPRERQRGGGGGGGAPLESARAGPVAQWSRCEEDGT